MSVGCWLNGVMQLLYTTDYTRQSIACKAILNGPPPDLTAVGANETLDPGALLDLSASYHPYENAVQRLQNISSNTEDVGLRDLSASAARVLEQRRPLGDAGRRCFREGCKEKAQAGTCQACSVCHVAFFCSAKCKHAAKLADHASCYLGRLTPTDPYKLDSVMYLIALMGYGKHWLHRLRALSMLSHHLAGPVPADSSLALELYKPLAAEARLLCRSGLAPALALFLSQLGGVLADRRVKGQPPWPDEWLEVEDPGAQEWGLGAAALRAGRLVRVLWTPRPPDLPGVEWRAAELAERAEALALAAAGDPFSACLLATGGGGGGGGGGRADGSGGAAGLTCGAVAALKGLVELCINAAPSFPRNARSAALEAVIVLHQLYVSRSVGAVLPVAAPECMSYISPEGLELLLTWEAPDKGGGGGGGKSAADTSRREVALQCLFRLLAKAPHSPPFKAVLRDKWHVVMALMRHICAPPRATPTAGSGSGNTGGGSGSGNTGGGGGGSTAAAALLVERWGELVGACVQYGTLEAGQLADARDFLLGVAGVELGPAAAAQVQPRAQQPPPQSRPQRAAADALRAAALDGLPALAGTMSRDQVLELLPYMGGSPSGAPTRPVAPPPSSPLSLRGTGTGTAAGTLPSTSSSSSSSKQVLFWPAACRLLPRGAALLLSWLDSGPSRAVAAAAAAAAAGPDGGGEEAERVGEAGRLEAVQVVKLYDYVRELLWNSVRQLEETLSAPPVSTSTSTSTSIQLTHAVGSPEADRLLQLAVRMQRALAAVSRSWECASDMVAAGVAPALARCILLSRSSLVDSALTLLAAACWPPELDIPWPPPPPPLLDTRDFGGCLSPGALEVVEALRRPHHVPKVAAAPPPPPQQQATAAAGAAAAAGQLRFVEEWPWERLLRLATDPRVGGAEQEVEQLAALRLVAVLVACADPATSLGLLADPRLATALLAVGAMLPGQQQQQQQQQQRPGGAATAANAAVTPLAPDPMLFFQLLGVYAAVVAAVPRWTRGAAGGGGVFAGGGDAAAASPAAVPSRSGKQGKKKGRAGAGGGGGGGGGAGPSSASLTAATAASGLRLAAELMTRVAPGCGLLPPSPEGAGDIIHRQAIRSLDELLYDMLEAAQPDEDVLGVLAQWMLRASKGAELDRLMQKLGWMDAALPQEAPVVPAPGLAAAVAPVAVAGGRPANPMAPAAASPASTLPRAVRQCAHCGAQDGEPGVGRLRKCGGCLVTRYCSSECQTAAWPQHKRECRALADAARQQQSL